MRDELADALFAEGQSEKVIVRELPVRFAAADTDEARAVGERIGARAVIIYRERETDGITEYIAYVVFTDSTVGLSVAGGEGAADGDVALTPQVNEGVAVPALKTSTIADLVGAAAGIIAYHDGEYGAAVTRLEAVADDDDSADSGIINFYLGSAYAYESRDDDASAALDRSIAYYEQRVADGERLGPQDQLVLARVYSGRGRIENHRDNAAAAIGWYEKAIGLREGLLARAVDLERPSDVYTTFARTYAEMGDMYRLQGDDEEATFWAQRARDEAVSVGNDDSDPQALVDRGAALFFAGDCGTAVSTLERAIERDPDNIDALNNLATFHLIQGDFAPALAGFERILELQPGDVTAREQIAYSFLLRAFSSDDYFEPSHITDAERIFADILEDEPTNREAREQLANLASWRSSTAQIDTNATIIGDTLTTTKSQTLWDTDPAQRELAMTAIADLIEQRRIIATELQPDSIPAQLDVAGAYVE